MSENVRSKEKSAQNSPPEELPGRLENIISVALTKLKKIWQHENALTGIQFYGDLED
jgi:hypothetical protein